MNQIILVAVGGGIGSVLRYGLSSSIYYMLGRGFPYGTLVVNAIGSLLMGFLTVLLLERLNGRAADLREFLLIGFLGGFTTFSAFSIETLNLFESGEILTAMLNIILSLSLCLIAVLLGSLLARQL